MARYADGPPGGYPSIGFHDDMFPVDTDNGREWSFLARMRRAKRIDTWKQTIIGGEMVPHAAKKWLGKKWNVTWEMVNRSHFSWVGPYGPALEARTSKEFVERSDKLVRRMGYQFRLTEIRQPQTVRVGGRCKILLRGVNEGVAPFYYPWPVKLVWLDVQDRAVLSTLTDDIRSWLPGKFSVEADLIAPLKPGSYRLALGIEDPWTKKPIIRFANDLPIAQGLTLLGEVEVGSP